MGNTRILRKISNFELSEILIRHSMWLMKEKGGICADLRYMDLSGADLEHKDLRCANLSYSNFAGASLNYLKACYLVAECSDFSRASLGSCDFTGANFENSTFESSDLSYSVFNFARLKGVNLAGANLTFTNVLKSDLTVSQLTLAKRGDYVREKSATIPENKLDTGTSHLKVITGSTYSNSANSSGNDYGNYSHKHI